MWAGPTGGTSTAQGLSQALAQAGIPVTSAETGHSLDLGGGARLEVLSVTPGGAVLLLEWERFHLLLPVGPDFAAMEALQSDLDLAGVSALLLSDSGYAPANSPELINALRPQVVLLSVAAGDRRGLSMSPWPS